MLKDLEIDMITLKLPFRLNHVNCFLAEGEKGYLIIDTGLHNQETIAHWEQALEGKEVSDIFITHYHPDHFGYAGGLQEKYQARVSMSEIDANNGLLAWDESLLSQLRANYLKCGIPESVSQAMTENTESFIERVTPYPKVTHYFQEHERLQIGKYEYEVLFTPGHSDGLITFFNEETKTLISTDHILPRITPNISYWFHGDPNPLETYLHSLNKIKQLNAQYVIPSHGKPFYDANKRIDEIIDHHDERLNETLDKLSGKHTVYDICQALFQFELTIHETRFAIGETIAHLEYLRRKKQIIREEIHGVWYYHIN